MSEDGSRPPDVAQATLGSYFGWYRNISKIFLFPN
eukprot:UN12134